MNGLRYIELSASLADSTLAEIGTDKFGQNQILVGVLPISGGNLQRVEITAEQWGNRNLAVPQFSDPTNPGANGPWPPPIYPEVIANSTVTVRGFQDSGGAETEGIGLFFQIAGPNGTYPAPMARHIGELHTQVIAGTATNGSFPAVGGATGTQDILNELPNDQWLPLMTASVGDTPGLAKWAHPMDEGYPPVVRASATIELGEGMFQPIPPTNLLNGADTLSLLAKDDAGAAVKAYLYTGRVTGGRKAVSNRTPYAL